MNSSFGELKKEEEDIFHTPTKNEEFSELSKKQFEAKADFFLFCVQSLSPLPITKITDFHEYIQSSQNLDKQTDINIFNRDSSKAKEVNHPKEEINQKQNESHQGEEVSTPTQKEEFVINEKSIRTLSQKSIRYFKDDSTSISKMKRSYYEFALKNRFPSLNNIISTYQPLKVQINQNELQENPTTNSTRKYRKRKDKRSKDLKSNGKQSKVFCKCRKSECLKMYCECFKNGKICGKDCFCKGCKNSLSNLSERNSAIKLLIQRNAFESNIQNSQFSVSPIQKNPSIGCTCRKSGCIKKYCECFQKGIKCGPLCQCIDCKNQDLSLLPKKEPKKEANFEMVFRPFNSTNIFSQKIKEMNNI